MTSMPSVFPANDFAPEIEAAFFREIPETSEDVRRIDGEIPDYVRGAYYLNGPARLDFAGQRYANWLDGDGMVCSLRFSESGVCVRNRPDRT
jgi:carotenoid cleavage dioxygenase-like enzyme